MTSDSEEWFHQANYDLGTAKILLDTKRYLPVIVFCHLAIEKALKALYAEKFHSVPEKTHNLVYLVEIIELDLPDHLIGYLLLINRLGITGRYPLSLENVLKEYTEEETYKILKAAEEVLAWLMLQSSRQ